MSFELNQISGGLNFYNTVVIIICDGDPKLIFPKLDSAQDNAHVELLDVYSSFN